MTGSREAASTSVPAAAYRARSQSASVSASESIVYACEIKETTDGGWRCACSKAGQAFQVVA
jgi:hypothetical protein